MEPHAPSTARSGLIWTIEVVSTNSWETQIWTLSMKIFFFSKQQLFIEILSWRPFEFGCANQPRSNWIETLWIFWPRYNCKNNILICPTLEFWMKDRRLFMMADLRDQASALVMNGLCWAQSISGGESENAIPQLEMIHSVKPRFLECQPLQSSHINNKKNR